ncbi:MAG: hypothetical protein H7328_10390 [Bdellovibrio sp.]|nr:hypothetical protein [Bdellovibrio sp.]
MKLRIVLAFTFGYFLLSPAFAGVLNLEGENSRFNISATFDEVGTNRLSTNETVINHFRFEYSPKKVSITPMDFYFRSIFGNKTFVLTEKDVEVVKNGMTLSSPNEGASGSYVELKLKPELKELMKGYYSIGIQLDQINQPSEIHNVVIFQDTLSTGQYYLHLLAIGRRYYRNSILTLNRKSDPSVISCKMLFL